MSEHTGFVYCAVNDENRLCKIGYSKDVHKRISQLNSGALIHVYLWLHMPAARVTESAFHYRMRRFKLRNEHTREYFRLTDESIRIIKHHIKHGFSASYIRRVKWRSEYRASAYKQKLMARQPLSKSPELSPVLWISQAAKLFGSNEDAVREFNRISPDIQPSYPSALKSIGEQVTRRIISKAQSKFASGIANAYIREYQKCMKYYSGEFLSELAHKQCWLCKKNNCACGLHITRRDISGALHSVYGDEYAYRHGYIKPSKQAQDFMSALVSICEQSGVIDSKQVDLSEAWKIA